MTHKVSGILMLLALLWLSVCTPFVYAAGQAVSKTMAKSVKASDVAPDANPLTDSGDEKAGSGVSSLSSMAEEYLHETHGHQRDGFTIMVNYFKCHPNDLYFSFHPSLVSPPPEIFG